MALQNYLHNRPNSSNFQVRLPVPSNLQNILGKREITKSMKTSDRRLAEIAAMKFISEERERFDRLSSDSENILIADVHTRIVDVYFDKFLQELRIRMAAAASAGIDDLDAWRTKQQRALSKWNQNLLARDYSRIKDTARKFVTKERFQIDPESADFLELLHLMVEVVVEALRIVIDQSEGNNHSAPRSSFIIGTKEAQFKISKPGERISDFVSKYINEQISEYGRKKTNLDQDKTVIGTFEEWIGKDRDIASITKKEAAAFREVISSLPKSRGKNSLFSGLSITECINLTKRRNLPLLSPATKSRYISQLSAFFNWLRKRGVCEVNIWESMNFKVDKTANRRPPYTTEQLNLVLSSPLFVGFEKNKKEHLPGEFQANDWRRWIPLLCMFTGARVTEIAQLYVDDIKMHEEKLIGYLKVDPNRGQSIKSGQKRLVVFHSILIAAGFKDYWVAQSMRSNEDGNKQLFPELSAGKRPELGAKPARWWGNYLTKINIKASADGLGTHSFRHRLSDEMRLAGYQNSEFGYLVMGHSDQSMTARYGEIPQGTVDRLHEMIEAAKFEGVNLNSLIIRANVKKPAQEK